MKTLKMSLANIQGKLSRSEMRKVMAGSQTACAAASTLTGEGTCYPDRDSAENAAGPNGWWQCNSTEAHIVCGY